MKETELALEKEFLEKINAAYTVNQSLQTKAMRKLIVRTFSPFIKNGRGLELGCSDGYMTAMLARYVNFLDVVDGSELFLEEARERAKAEHLENISFIYSLFEEFSSHNKYDYVIASYILEHVLHPVDVLRMAYDALKDDGLLFVVVPNGNALSRQLAVHMGIYEHSKILTENDLKHGHRRVYDRTSLNKEIEQAGFENIAQGGLMLKILADFQMDKLIEEGILGHSQIDGLYKLGLEYPDLCGSLFSVCRKKNEDGSSLG